ncbi:hypothetical protein ES705_35478 [subsurface metagenome]
MKLIKIVLTITFLVYSGCNEHAKKGRLLKEMAIKNSYNIDFENCIVICVPLNGCPSCVKNSINYLKKNYQNESVYFILSSIFLKHFEYIKDTINITKANNIFFDYENYTGKYQLVEFYPRAYYFSDKKLKEIVKLDTEQKYNFLQTMLTER